MTKAKSKLSKPKKGAKPLARKSRKVTDSTKASRNDDTDSEDFSPSTATTKTVVVEEFDAQVESNFVK